MLKILHDAKNVIPTISAGFVEKANYPSRKAAERHSFDMETK